MKRLAVVVLASLLLPRPGHSVTMEEAVSLALANNHRLRDSRQRTEAQERRVDSGKAPFWPELEATYRYDRQEEVFSFFQTRDTSTFTAEVRYNLFRGFSDVNTLNAARSTLDAARYEQKAAEADVVLEVKRAYIDLLRVRKSLEVARESVELLERQRRDAELFYRGGLTAKNEYLKVEVELASARQDLLRAESAARVARKGLGRVIGAPVGEEEPIGEIAFGEPAGLDEAALAPPMLERRSELRVLEAQRQARERARDSIRGGYLPSVDLSVAHSRFGEMFAFEGREDPLFDSDTSAMVEAKWSLFDGFRKRSDILAESAEIRAIEERIRDTEEDLRLQLRTAIEEYRVAAGRIVLARKSVEQAEENYRITQSQFRERVATAADLLDARVFLTRARTESNNAFYDLGLSLAILERVVEGPATTGPAGGGPAGN
jgi:outer membrane protein TolC